MRIEGKASGVPEPTVDRAYVLSFDPDAHDGGGELMTTRNARNAKRFASTGEAFEFWRQASTVRPLREDGKPNRPFTAFTVSIEGVE